MLSYYSVLRNNIKQSTKVNKNLCKTWHSKSGRLGSQTNAHSSGPLRQVGVWHVVYLVIVTAPDMQYAKNSRTAVPFSQYLNVFEQL